MKQWWYSLQMSRAERNGLMVLLVLVGILVSVRVWLVYWQPSLPQGNIAQFREEIAAFEADTLLELNAATAEALQQLPGIGPSMAEKIITYRNELGGYSYAEQLMDIPGIGTAKLEALLPFISIDTTLAKVVLKPDPLAHPVFEENETDDSYGPPYPVKLKPGERIEINTATADDWQRVPGIGQAFAARIMAYRERLGGFYKAEQLQEVTGLGQAKYQAMAGYLTLDTSSLRKININIIGETDLLLHPYTHKTWVEAVMNGRPYKDLGQVSQLESFDDRLLPYLIVE